MEWWLVLIFIFGAFIILLATGLPVAFCFMAINLVGVYIYWGGISGLQFLTTSMFASITVYALRPVVMFVLMGEVLFHSGVFVQAIDTLDKWMGRLPGRLGLLTVGSATLFSTLSGSSMGTTAMLGSLLTPEMERRGYKKPMSLGPILGAGGLAMIIPPSALAVILAALAEVSVGKVLIAGVFPGLLMAALYSCYIVFRCKFQPSIAPSYEPIKYPLSEKLLDTVRYVLPFGFVIMAVIGFIFLGIASPTEAAACAALVCFLITAAYRSLNWKVVVESAKGTLTICVMMFIILTGATAFSQIMAYSGATAGLVGFVTTLKVPPLLLIIFMQILILILGCLMEQVSIMMISFPIMLPVVNALGFDMIWFALLVLINMEVGLTSPPFGLTLFVMKGVAPPDTTMKDVYLAGLPFIGCDIIAMACILLFPPIALWLPNIMTY